MQRDWNSDSGLPAPADQCLPLNFIALVAVFMVFYVQMLSNSTLHAYWFTSSAFKPFVAKIGSYILCRTVIGERVSRTQVYPVNKGHKRVTTGTRLCIGGDPAGFSHWKGQVLRFQVPMELSYNQWVRQTRERILSGPLPYRLGHGVTWGWLRFSPKAAAPLQVALFHITVSFWVWSLPLVGMGGVLLVVALCTTLPLQPPLPALTFVNSFFVKFSSS